MAISPSTLTELPLLRTKISIPQIPSGSINRPRLTEKVHRGVEGPLTLLAAPAGLEKPFFCSNGRKRPVFQSPG